MKYVPSLIINLSHAIAGRSTRHLKREERACLAAPIQCVPGKVMSMAVMLQKKKKFKNCVFRNHRIF